MNLKTLWNKNYFKENLKKSKGLLAFFFGVVPLLNILILIVRLLNGGVRPEFIDISMITLMGLYIIPLILATSLFGFIFNSRSVDFTMSKPISRKTIYFTNMIGGIMLLIAFILLNTCIFGAFSLLSNSLIIPGKMLVDYFVLFSIGYIFMFTVMSIAIFLSGNLITSIAVAMILLCIYPFLSSATTYLTNNDTINYIKCTSSECMPTEPKSSDSKIEKGYYPISIQKEYGDTYTLPIRTFTGEPSNLYSSKSIVKMSILSIIYLALGYLAFKQRKMEETGVDFKDSKKHYFVKSITFLPVTFIVYELIDAFNLIGIIIGLAICIIYYIIYDLIVRKEIYKPVKSLLVCIISFIVFMGGYSALDAIHLDSMMNASDVTSINISPDDKNIAITDKTLINKIIKSHLNLSVNNRSFYGTEITANNKKYILQLDLDEKTAAEVVAYTNTKYREKLLNYNYDKINAVDYNQINFPYTKEFKNLITDGIKNYNGETTNNFVLYTYENHKYQEIHLPLNLNEAIKSYIYTSINNESIKVLNKNRDNVYFRINYMEDEEFASLGYEVMEYVISHSTSEIIKYVTTNNKMINNDTEIILWVSTPHTSINPIYITDINKFKLEYKKWASALENDKEYQYLVREQLDFLRNEANEY